MAANTKQDRRKIKFPPWPAIDERPLIDEEQALALMRLFKVFANDTRLRLLHALLRDEELCVSEMADAVGMKPQAVSNQLQRLSTWRKPMAWRKPPHVQGGHPSLLERLRGVL